MLNLLRVQNVLGRERKVQRENVLYIKKISLVPIFVHMIKFSDNRYSHPNFELFINIKQQQFF